MIINSKQNPIISWWYMIIKKKQTVSWAITVMMPKITWPGKPGRVAQNWLARQLKIAHASGTRCGGNNSNGETWWKIVKQWWRMAKQWWKNVKNGETMVNNGEAMVKNGETMVKTGEKWWNGDTMLKKCEKWWNNGEQWRSNGEKWWSNGKNWWKMVKWWNNGEPWRSNG